MRGRLPGRLHPSEKDTQYEDGRHEYRGLAIEISQRGQNIEPEGIPRETSLILPQVLKALYKEGLTRDKVAQALAIPTSELEYLLSGLVITGMEGGRTQLARESSAPAKLNRVK